jgi:hypothetical protein
VLAGRYRSGRLGLQGKDYGISGISLSYQPLLAY